MAENGSILLTIDRDKLWEEKHPDPYLTHTINIHIKTICYVIKNIRVALRLEK
jgi:hypothetical protein